MVKKLISWVHPGFELVLTRFFRFTRVLINEDLPTLDLPAKAISGRSGSVNWTRFGGTFDKFSLLNDHGDS